MNFQLVKQLDNCPVDMNTIVNVLVCWCTAILLQQELMIIVIDPWLTVKSASCPLCKHDCSLDIPGNTEQTENDGTSSSNENRTQQQQQLQPPPPAAFGPTMSPEQIEALNQSWVLRTLPRTMRRQIREAAATNDGGSTMVLPARMTQDNPIQVQEQQDPSPRDTSFAGRLIRSLPTRWQRR